MSKIVEKILPKGNIIKIDGIPLRTLTNVVIETSEGNWSLIRDKINGGDVMETQEIIKEIQDTLAKVQGALNLLKDGKQILVNNKLLGIQQKLVAVLQRMCAGDTPVEKTDGQEE